MKKLMIGCALAVPALVGLMSLAYAPEAEALAASMCETEYYSDATYTTAVGGTFRNCQGGLIVWGTATPYSKLLYCEPCFEP